MLNKVIQQCASEVESEFSGSSLMSEENKTCDVCWEYNMTHLTTAQPSPNCSAPARASLCNIVPVPNTAWLVSSTPDASALDSLRSTTVPRGSDNDPVTAAAYLHLLGESLSLIGHYLQETDKVVCVPNGLSVLLDSLLCTLAPLMSLTSHIPELQGVLEHTVDSTLENVSYVMPGL